MVADTLARTVNRLVADGITSDAELLHRFVATRDEIAFTQLVRRHGPMVFAVCRRSLGHVHDAEDAFQAAFLVLARKAHTIRPDSLSRWLYAVAVRVANKARRSRRLPASVEFDAIAAPPAQTAVDWIPHFDAAVAKLSDRDRGPILLCDVLGRSRAEAAAELGVGEGTLSSRLARARVKLRMKLTRLGIVPSVLTVAALAPESVPAALIDSTRLAGSTAARELAEGVIRAMAITKLTNLAAIGVCLLGTATAGIVLVPAAGAGPTPGAKDAPKQPPSVESTKPARSDAERFKGAWVIESARRSGGDDVSSWVDEEMIFDGSSVRFSRFTGRPRLYTLDPGWDQKRIDFEMQNVLSGTTKTTVRIPAIYRFEGEKLHLVLGIVDLDERPDSFEPSDKGPPFTHIVLRRSKEQPKDPAADERKALEGAWTLVAVEQGGVRRETAGTNLLFKGQHLTFRPPPDRVPLTEADYSLNLEPSPRQIDMTIVAGRPESRGLRMMGIYSRDRDVLKLRLNENTKDRPTTFDAADGPPTMYFVREGSEAKLPPAPTTTPPSPPTTKLPAGRLHELKQERVKALEEQLKTQTERVEQGKDSMTSLFDAVHELADAEVDLATTQEAKIAALEKLLKYLREYELTMTKLYDAGQQSKQGLVRAKAARLKAEIELEKVKEGK
ncbi:MAG TPA: sigma-70 family RNA polymerase sigma factor [Gemmataceae bacterium]|jgi:RNA polymerase sigma factor (sigma-70 family)|nr:sigma-70 family RNA polymerase sigma factor [Gemmataceae bacterium]